MRAITGLSHYKISRDGIGVETVTIARKPILWLSPGYVIEDCKWWDELCHGKKNHFENASYRKLFMEVLGRYKTADCYLGISHILAFIISGGASELLAQIFLAYSDVSVIQQDVHDGVPADRDPKTFKRKDHPSHCLIDTNYRKPEYCKGGDTRRPRSTLALLAWQAVWCDEVVWSDLANAEKYPSYEKQSIASWLEKQKEAGDLRSYMDELNLPVLALRGVQRAKSSEDFSLALEDLLNVPANALLTTFIKLAEALSLSHDSNQPYVWRYFLSHTQAYYKHVIEVLTPDSVEALPVRANDYRAACKAALLQLQQYNNWGGLTPTLYQTASRWLIDVARSSASFFLPEDSSPRRYSEGSATTASEESAKLLDASRSDDQASAHRAGGGGGRDSASLHHRGEGVSRGSSSDSVCVTLPDHLPPDGRSFSP